jgi:hypothetical protein
MKLTDFGLWFECWSGNSYEWSVTIPKNPDYEIYYDGYYLGKQWSDFDLLICDNEPHIIRLKNKFLFKKSYRRIYSFDRPLTLDDFEIIPNPDYRGDQ